MKRAFTLIELLVVIAIIAILAAILFPVFAQAKAAAKKTASLSGVKQISLAAIQYSAQNNDNFMVSDSFGGHTADANTYFGAPVGVWQPWPLLVFPYIKSLDMMNDPLAPKYTPPNDGFQNLNGPIGTSWGYNSSYLSPVTFDSNGNATETTKSPASLANPAATVFITSRYSQTETDIPLNAVYFDAGFGTASNTDKGYVDPPDCNDIPQACMDNWGTGGFYDQHLKSVYEAGAQTGGVSVRTNNGSIVAFCDGHAARLSIGALAAGTNWVKGIAASNVKINDTTKYLWDDQ